MGDHNQMSLLQKIKILVWINQLFNSLSKGGSKMGKLLGKLDGVKSVAGLLMITAYYALPQFGIQVPEVVLNVGTGIAGLGLAHKLEKGVGLLSKGLDIGIKVLTVSKAVLEQLNKKEEVKPNA
jgi:hypothetical protein